MASFKDEQEYVTMYTPSLLESIPRQKQRQTLGIAAGTSAL